MGSGRFRVLGKSTAVEAAIVVCLIVIASLAVSALQKLVIGVPLHAPGFLGALVLGVVFGALIAARSTRLKSLIAAREHDLENLKLILETVPAAIAHQDREGVLIWRNAGARELDGVRQEASSVEEADSEGAPLRCFETRMGRDHACEPCIVREAIDSGVSCVGRVCLQTAGNHRVVAVPYSRPGISRPTALVSFVNVEPEAKVERGLRHQLAARDLLLREVHHRMKNNLQLVSSLIALQCDGQEPTGSLARLEARIRTMAIVHEQLYQRDDIERIGLNSFLDAVVTTVVRKLSQVDLVIATDVFVDEVELEMECASPLGLIVNELTTNSIEHAFKGRSHGVIRIRSQMSDGRLRLIYTDDGTGMPSETVGNGSAGLKLVEALASQLGGSFRVEHGSPGYEARLAIPHAM